jgi:hypothetical protein
MYGEKFLYTDSMSDASYCGLSASYNIDKKIENK